MKKVWTVVSVGMKCGMILTLHNKLADALELAAWVCTYSQFKDIWYAYIVEGDFVYSERSK